MGAETEILDYLSKHPEGASISGISEATGHTRATAAKYLEVAKLQNKVKYREVGKAKLWVLAEKSKRILVAEDEEHIRRLIKVVLESENYHIIEARDGKEALEKVSDEMPDLIILDLMMPKVDGIEACKHLKKNVLTRKIPVIMLTAKREMADKVVGVSAGADDYLTKPFEPRELRVRVRTFLQKGRRERNPVTNLPTFEHILNKLKNLDNELKVHYIFFKNLGLYRKNYGFSKTNELVRLTSQIITHHLERFGTKNFAGHDEDDNFIVAVEKKQARNALKEIQNEFESTIPFFYDVDYDSLDFKNNLVIKMSGKGSLEKMPLIQLDSSRLNSEDLQSIEKMNEKLKQLRGE